MSPQEQEKPAKLSSRNILWALLVHFDALGNRAMSEFEVPGDGGQFRYSRADFIVITKAGYVTEVEIKISMADWKNDLKKDKWKEEQFISRRCYRVSRFYYAVPRELVKREVVKRGGVSCVEYLIPEFVPQHAGVLLVSEHGYISVARKAARLCNEKAPEHVAGDIERAAYYRYWRDKLRDYKPEGRQARSFT